MAFQDFPPSKNTRGATHPPTDLLPLFAGLAPPIARARYLTTCPENSPAPQPKRRAAARLSGNARFDEIPGWFGENKKGCFFRRFRNGGMKTKRRTCGRWVSFSFLGSWSSRSGVWSPLLACEAPSWTNWFVERGCIFPKPVDACLVKSVDLESQDLFYEWQGFGGYGDASPLLTGTTGFYQRYKA